MRVFTTQLTVAHQSMSLMHTFENDNKAFKALTIQVYVPQNSMAPQNIHRY